MTILENLWGKFRTFFGFMGRTSTEGVIHVATVAKFASETRGGLGAAKSDALPPMDFDGSRQVQNELAIFVRGADCRGRRPGSCLRGDLLGW